MLRERVAASDAFAVPMDASLMLLHSTVPHVTDFMDDDISSLVHTSIFATDPIEQKRAYEILTLDETHLLEVSLSTHSLRNAIRESLDNPTTSCLSRSAELIDTALREFPQRAVFEFDFLPEFLSFCGAPVVVDMFASIVDESCDASPFIAHWLARIGIDCRLMEEYEAACESESPDPECVMGLLEVLNAFLGNPALHDLFEIEMRTRVLLSPIKGVPSYVTERHLGICSLLLSEDSFTILAERIPEFQEKLAPTCPVDSVFVATMKLVLEMLIMRPDCGFDVHVLLEAAFRVWTEFQEHSLALRQASEVLMTLMTWNDLQSDIVDRVLLTAQYVMGRGSNKIMRAFCYEMMLAMATSVDWDKHDKVEYDSIFRAYVVPMGVALQQEF